MAPIAVLLLFLLPLLAIHLHFTKRNSNKNNKQINLPPGPPKLPIIGSLHLMGPIPHRSVYKFSQKYGPIVYLKLGSVPVVVASSSDAAREFLKVHDLDCCSRPLVTSMDKLSYGFADMAVIPYGEQWRELRKICIVHFFSTKKVNSFRSLREEEVQRLMSTIVSASSSSPEPIDLSAELILLANDITCRTALGRRYAEKSGEVKIHEILMETQAVAAGFYLNDYLPKVGWIVDQMTGMRARLDKNFQDLDDFYEQVIKEHEDPTTSEERNEDMLDAILEIKKIDPRWSYETVKGLLTDIFIAGSGTSASTVEWGMTELMKNQKAMRKAQEEVRSVFGDKGKIDENDLHRLTYLKAVVKETFRMHPPVPLLLPRETIQDCKIQGYDIPAKSRLLISAWAIGRDPDVWVRPDEFDPDRFIDSPIDFKGQDFELIPFGGGRRICPGMHLGNLIVELTLANLLYLFNWEFPRGVSEESIDMSEAPGLTVHRKVPLSLVATRNFDLKV